MAAETFTTEIVFYLGVNSVMGILHLLTLSNTQVHIVTAM